MLCMTMTMTIKITLLPCNTWSILSNGITSTGYIQNQSIVYKKERKVHGKGDKKQELMCPNITWNIFIWGCNRNRTVQVQWYQLSFHQLCFTSYCYFELWEKKILLFLATTIREETKHGHYCGGITTFIKIQVDNRSSFEFRSNLAKKFLKVPMAQSISISDRIKFQIQAPE